MWIGDRPADPDLIPDFSHFDRADPKLLARRQCIEMKANYVLIVENLLDLSHVCVLHDGLLGNAAMTDAQIKLEELPDGFVVRRFMHDVPAPKAMQLLCDVDEGHIDTWADIRLMGVSSLTNNVGVIPTGGDRETASGLLGSHILTPIDERTTLYHFCAMRVNPPPRSPEEDARIVGEFSDLARWIFAEQDAVVIQAQQQMIDDPSVDTTRPAMFDVDIGAARYARVLDALRVQA